MYLCLSECACVWWEVHDMPDFYTGVAIEPASRVSVIDTLPTESPLQLFSRFLDTNPTLVFL